MGRHLLRGRLQPAWHCSKFHVVLPLLSHSRTLTLHLGLPSLTRPARARGRARAAPFPQPFNALFEIVSCFGNVGLTLGVTVDEPDLAGMAFSAQVNGVSKIMFMLVMIVGRTRGMPTRMDAAFSTSRSLSKDEILKKVSAFRCVSLLVKPCQPTTPTNHANRWRKSRRPAGSFRAKRRGPCRTCRDSRTAVVMAVMAAWMAGIGRVRCD